MRDLLGQLDSPHQPEVCIMIAQTSVDTEEPVHLRNLNFPAHKSPLVKQECSLVAQLKLFVT